jgi:hypothetical protein
MRLTSDEIAIRGSWRGDLGPYVLVLSLCIGNVLKEHGEVCASDFDQAVIALGLPWRLRKLN